MQWVLWLKGKEGVYFGVRSLPLDLDTTPEKLFSAFEQNFENAFLLESSEGSGKNARFSFVGFGPEKTVKFEGKEVFVDNEAVDAKNPLDVLKSELPSTDAEGAGFVGGAVGYFSFEYYRSVEEFSSKLSDETGFPDFEFGIFNDAVVFDHATGKHFYTHLGKSRLPEIRAALKDSASEQDELKIVGGGVSGSRADFAAKVEKAKEHIAAGDAFQIVLSRRHSVSFNGNLGNFYRMLKVANPSPYLYFMKFGKKQLIGSSPENLFKVEGSRVSSYATIAGTRPRGKNIEDDRFLEEDLLSDPKERAEHIMLVDLTRNDLGKVAKPGTVKVPEFMNVHKYSHVQHIASFVEAELAKGKGSFDVFNAIFPAGTVSGAPKIRATEIIGELEKIKRGPYAGAFGYFSSNGNADFAIGIRSLYANRNNAYVQAGAGIVQDSVPEREFNETENKARVLIDCFYREGKGHA